VHGNGNKWDPMGPMGFPISHGNGNVWYFDGNGNANGKRLDVNGKVEFFDIIPIPNVFISEYCYFEDLCDPADSHTIQQSELADYVNMRVNREVDMIDFWLQNRTILPKLFAVACKVLCIPASSAASERVFITAGRLLEKRRTSSRQCQQFVVFAQQHVVK